MTSDSRHATSQRPAGPAAVALLCLLGYLAGFLHLALVRHATCPVHDEIIHAGAAEAVISDVTETAGVAPVVVEPGHTDDHCLVVATTRRQAAPSGAADQLLAAAPCTVAGSVALYLVVADPIARLLVAPKNSPPTARV
jgi:hypothetical protein